MFTTFMDGVVTDYTFHFKMYSRNNPIENVRYSLHMLI